MLRRRAPVVLLHRYVGLATALFLAVAGLTGSVIAFHHEIDEWLNPDFYAARGRGPLLSPTQLAERLERDNPQVRVWYLSLRQEAGEAALLVGLPKVNPADGKPFRLAYNWFQVDPVTGETLGRRLWGACCFERQNVVPFMYELHYRLMIPGPWGSRLMGAVALLWVFDCFFGLVLTFPRGRPFFAKWQIAWTVKGGSLYRRYLDWHRAGGLWLWAVLLLIAISGVALNLRKEVFEPVVSLFSSVTPSVFARRGTLPPDRPKEPLLTYDAILARAVAEAKRRDWTLAPGEIFHSRTTGLYGVGFGGPDIDGWGSSWLYFDDQDGTLFGENIPGQGTAGDVFIQLQTPIHGGRIAGLPGRIAVALAGLVTAMLSITGIVIWWRKRLARAPKYVVKQRISGTP